MAQSPCEPRRALRSDALYAGCTTPHSGARLCTGASGATHVKAARLSTRTPQPCASQGRARMGCRPAPCVMVLIAGGEGGEGGCWRGGCSLRDDTLYIPITQASNKIISEVNRLGWAGEKETVPCAHALWKQVL